MRRGPLAHEQHRGGRRSCGGSSRPDAGGGALTWRHVVVALSVGACAVSCGASSANAGGDAGDAEVRPADIGDDGDARPSVADADGDAGADAADGVAPSDADANADAAVADAAPTADADADADVIAPPADGHDDDADGDLLPDGDASGCPEGASCALAVAAGPCRTGRCDAAGACAATAIPGCCTADGECASLAVTSACDVYRCSFSQCTIVRSPSCCDAAAGCDDGLACTADSCGADTGLCRHCPSGCSCAPPILAAGFDGLTLDPGFTVEDDVPWDAVTWRPSTRRAVRPPGAAYLGRADCPSYDTGALGADCLPIDPFSQDATRVRATLVTPPLPLPADLAAPTATVWVWADVEPWIGAAADEPDLLRISVAPADGGPDWEVTSTLAVGKRTDGGWRLLAVDLTPWQGRTVRLRFTFDTLDGQDNAHEGVYLDELRVVGGCGAGGCCATDADCPGVAADACGTVRCVALTNGAGRLCAEVPTRPGEACAPCGSDADCDDGDACTADRCAATGACEHDAFCCLRLTAWAEGFDAGLGAWIVDDPVPGDGVAWRPASAAFTGPGAAWFGAPESGTYATGAPVHGSLTSPPVALPPASPTRGLELAFALALETEWDGPPYDNPAGVDQLTLTVLTAQATAVLWTSDAVEGATHGAWVPINVDLAAYAGQTVQFRFAFDSVDGEANAFDGARIDAVEVRTACSPGD